MHLEEFKSISCPVPSCGTSPYTAEELDAHLILEHHIPMYGMMCSSQNVRRLCLVVAAAPKDEGPEPELVAPAVSIKQFMSFDVFSVIWLGSPGLVLWMFNRQARPRLPSPRDARQ
jgi:hypothetical protein